MPDKSFTTSILWDRFGLSISIICAIHCLFFPVMIALLPVVSSLAYKSEWLHPIFVLLIAPTVYFASKRSHFDPVITRLLVWGFLFVLFGWLIGHYWLGYWVEAGATLAGSIMLIVGHWRNYRHHQTCSNENHRHHVVEESKEEHYETA